MKLKLLTMLQMQDEMNRKVHPEWRNQHYEWYRAIWVECAELMDHYGWKWWKKQTPDRDQVVLELIDIWHFGLSDLLQEDEPAESIAVNLAGIMAVTPTPDADFRELVESFAEKTLTLHRFDPALFSNLLASMDIPLESLYRSYVGKNVLNFFRQDNGYKEGNYIKVWDQREDNVHLVEILATLDCDSPTYRNDVYTALQKRYPM